MAIHEVPGNQGEVGSALQSILRRSDGFVHGFDKDDRPNRVDSADFLHICYPWSPMFIRDVREDADTIFPSLDNRGIMVIHSTVPVGTCSALGPNVVHSPIRGIHPHLDLGIQQFTKFFGGPRAEEAAVPFRQLGIDCVTTPKAENTEALKLWDTTQHGVSIVLEKEIHEYCERHGLDFNIVYTQANATYNSGYHALNCDRFCRPVLKHTPGPIGGHCVVQNAAILGDNWPARLIREKQADLSAE